MSWKKILKGKSSLSINQKAKEMIEDIMSDGKERSGIQVYVSSLAKKGVFEVVGKTRPTKYVKKN